jgi:hypothetical protein
MLRITRRVIRSVQTLIRKPALEVVLVHVIAVFAVDLIKHIFRTIL